VPPVAILLVLVAAALHAGWNVLLKTSGDTLGTAVRLQALGTAILLPLAVVGWFLTGQPAIDPGGVGIAAVSGVLEALYFICLSAAYARGDLSLVYPLARGSAPLLAVVVGVGVLGENLAPGSLAGVICLLAGILLVARPWRALRVAGREHRGAIGFALATGATIAAYSAVDRVGVRTMPPWLYGAILAVFATTILSTTVAVARRRGLVGRPGAQDAGAGEATGDRRRGGRRTTWRLPRMRRRDAIAGVASLTAYLLILFAYSIAPLATVAPLRESGIVLAAAWGSIRLGETSGGREAGTRIVAAGFVVLGAILLAVSA
jgi:drug/metabolite transporter (DMT)-like permease